MRKIVLASFLFCAQACAIVTINDKLLSNIPSEVSSTMLFDPPISTYIFKQGYDKLGVCIEIDGDKIKIVPMTDECYNEFQDFISNVKLLSEERYNQFYPFPLTLEKKNLFIEDFLLESPILQIEGEKIYIEKCVLKGTDYLSFSMNSSTYQGLPCGLIVFKLNPDSYHALEVFAGKTTARKSYFFVTGVQEVRFVFSGQAFK